MDQLMELLKKADFSKETDLKERLRQQLFGGDEQQKRRALSDDEAGMVAAAGDVNALMPKREAKAQSR